MRDGRVSISKSSKKTRHASLSLKEVICLCAESRNDEAWEEFVSRAEKPVSFVVMRTAALWGEHSRAVVEDLIQITYLKLWEGGGSHLRDFAIQRPEAIWGYLKRTAANATHDSFKHSHSQSSGGSTLHLSTSDIDPKAGREVHGSEEQIASSVFLQEIDEHLKHCLTSPDQERDRMIFWLYFRQGMSTKEIASLPAIGLSAKGVGSVIERVKHSIRDQILGTARNSDDKQG
jgi:RNA polymerase sigma-70 factor (ECF subfamily)